MKKPTVAVIFGSRSAEHDVSIVTAIASIIKPLEMSKLYDVVPVYIAKSGAWYGGKDLKDIKLFSSGRIESWLKNQKPLSVRFGKGLELVGQGLGAKTAHIDIAFPATHGTHGEDGELMGILEMADVPYVGCSVQASAIAMDKVTSKLLAAAQGVPITKFKFFSTTEFAEDQSGILSTIENELSYPLFVKPAHLGSSIAISRVVNITELRNAIEVALHYDDKVLVEEAVNNLVEVTQPIIGNETLTLAMLEQPLPKGDDIFDFETKYMNQGKGGKKMGAGKSQGAQGYSKLPAELPDNLYEQAQSIASATYTALGCCGIARVDMLIDSKTGNIYFNEVNPLPGSLYSHNWRASGISNVELVKRLISLALERHNAKSKLSMVFETNFLKQF